MSYAIAEAMVELRAKHEKLMSDTNEAFKKLENKIGEMGKKVGDKVEVEAPAGKLTYKILSIVSFFENKKKTAS